MNEIKSNNTANDNKIEKQTILAVDDEEKKAIILFQQIMVKMV